MRYILLLSFVLFCDYCIGQESVFTGTSILYDRKLNNFKTNIELEFSKANAQYTEEGLLVSKPNSLVKLNRYYALAQRHIRYHVKLSADAIVVFQSDKGDFRAIVDMPNQKISIATDPVLENKVANMSPEHEYLVEIYRDYQRSAIKLINLFTGEETEVTGINDGTGGVGKGTENKGFQVGRQYDYYTFGLLQGESLLVKQITIQANQVNPILLIYGDSITEPEGYYPSKSFDQAWTQLIIKHLQGKAISSGRGGTTINELLERIKNELPYIKPKYAMITIGTNGGNTIDNLSQLVEYIKSQGTIPILNNIPANESSSHILVNEIIEKVRQKYNIKGCKFDIATSINQLGKEVDQSTMYFEDYEWGKIYHHPNVKGSKLMYIRALIDVPEIYQ